VPNVRLQSGSWSCLHRPGFLLYCVSRWNSRAALVRIAGTCSKTRRGSDLFRSRCHGRCPETTVGQQPFQTVPGLVRYFKASEPRCPNVFVEHGRLHATRTALVLTLRRPHFQSEPRVPWRVPLNYRVRIRDGSAACHSSGHVTVRQYWAVRIPLVATWPVVPARCVLIRHEVSAV